MPIAARFHEARDAVLSATDRAFAEPVRILPLKGGKVDAGRQPHEFEAVLRVGGGKETNIAGGFAQTWRTQLAAGKAELHIDRATYDGYQPQQKDKIVALARHGEPMFEVLRVDDRGENRLVLELGEI